MKKSQTIGSPSEPRTRPPFSTSQNFAVYLCPQIPPHPCYSNCALPLMNCHLYLLCDPLSSIMPPGRSGPTDAGPCI